jgi:hypothetical protein
MASIGGGPAAASAGQGQQPILHFLDERLGAPWTKLPAGRKDPTFASGAAGQLHKINRLVQHGAGLLRIVLEDRAVEVELANHACGSLEELATAAEQGIGRVRGESDLLFSFLHQSGLSL